MTIWELECSYKPIGTHKADALISGKEFYDYFLPAFEKYPQQEALFACYLDICNIPLCLKLITLGLSDTTMYHPREVIGPGLIPSISCARVAIAHNHPSGDPYPSNADKRATQHLRKACEALNIHLREHTVVGDRLQDPLGKGFFSFFDQGYLTDDYKPEHIKI